MTIGIIGFGQVTRVLTNLDFITSNLSYIVIRNFEKFINEIPIGIQSEIQNKVIKTIDEIVEFADINLILVNDKNIQPIVVEIVEQLQKKKLNNTDSDNNNKKIFIHFSGNLDLNVLYPISELGYEIVKLHPFQTFAVSQNTDLTDTAWLCELKNYENVELKNQIKDFVSNLKGKVFFRNDFDNFDDRFYHLAAVFASNYLNTFIQLSKDMAHFSGIPIQEFLLPIINQTLKNNFSERNQNTQTNFPISGPIVRNDVKTIENHLSALNSIMNENSADNLTNKYLEFYKLFGKLTIDYALKNGKFENENIDDLKKLFE